MPPLTGPIIGIILLGGFLVVAMITIQVWSHRKR
jgi:hypothetical protein